MRNKFLVVISFLAILFMPAILFGQASDPSTLTTLVAPLEDDLSTLFEGFGNDLIDDLALTSLSGNTIGKAKLGTFLPFGINVGLGIVPNDGIGGFLTSTSTPWAFTLFEIPTLVNDALSGLSTGGDPLVGSLVNASDNLFALPSINLSIATGIGNGFELIVDGMVIPQDFATSILTNVVPDMADSITLDVWDLNLILRKVLFDGSEGAALSIGAGYDFSSIQIGYTLDSIADFNNGDLFDANGLAYLDAAGSLNFNTLMNGIGFEINLSDTWLVFTPFVKVAGWYHWLEYHASSELTATLYTDEAGQNVMEAMVLEPQADVLLADFNTYVTAGMEFDLVFFVLHVSAIANLQSLVFEPSNLFDFDFSNINFEDMHFDNFGINVGFRLSL